MTHILLLSLSQVRKSFSSSYKETSPWPHNQQAVISPPQPDFKANILDYFTHMAFLTQSRYSSSVPLTIQDTSCVKVTPPARPVRITSTLPAGSSSRATNTCGYRTQGTGYHAAPVQETQLGHYIPQSKLTKSYECWSLAPGFEIQLHHL